MAYKGPAAHTGTFEIAVSAQLRYCPAEQRRNRSSALRSTTESKYRALVRRSDSAPALSPLAAAAPIARRDMSGAPSLGHAGRRDCCHAGLVVRRPVRPEFRRTTG